MIRQNDATNMYPCWPSEPKSTLTNHLISRQTG